MKTKSQYDYRRCIYQIEISYATVKKDPKSQWLNITQVYFSLTLSPVELGNSQGSSLPGSDPWIQAFITCLCHFSVWFLLMLLKKRKCGGGTLALNALDQNLHVSFPLIFLARIGHTVSPISKSTEKFSLPVFPEKGEEPGRSEHLLSLLKGFQQNKE